MPAVLVTAMPIPLLRTRRFLPSGGRTIAGNHFAYPSRDRQVELAWVID